MYYLITGGAGSGKSEYAEALAVSLAKSEEVNSLYYIATMFPYDDPDTKKRIERHRSLRAGKGFVTIERPLDIGRVMGEISGIREKSGFIRKRRNPEKGRISLDDEKTVIHCDHIGGGSFHEDNCLSDAVVLIEDLTNLYANECYETDGHPHDITGPLRELASCVRALIVVSNELYSDGTQYSEETMGFLKGLSFINREIAEAADQVVEVVAGIPVLI
ncbi:adenosyl cobinamide kinase/adenosyl cobinamide phosphate guanylyltransferase [Lachnospiraceae bacterium JC7]|nr:adenosyl cobinamide kinase/adenosyl cobinamide phosphate guanylyltransferase [Lachnospiraceae bacterium JC7]